MSITIETFNRKTRRALKPVSHDHAVIVYLDDKAMRSLAVALLDGQAWEAHDAKSGALVHVAVVGEDHFRS